MIALNWKLSGASVGMNHAPRCIQETRINVAFSVKKGENLMSCNFVWQYLCALVSGCRVVDAGIHGAPFELLILDFRAREPRFRRGGKIFRKIRFDFT